LGLGGACVLGAYKKYNDKQGWSRPDQTADPDKLEQLEGAGKAPVAKASEAVK